MSDSAAMTVPTSNAEREARLRSATERAVDRALGDEVSPELKKAATEAVAPWVERWVHWLEDLIRVPGTKFGIGLDALIGFLVPGAGDTITGVGSMSLLVVALKHRVPTIALLRMCMNILVDTVLGALPVVGDAFDVFWRSNRRNLDIINKYKDDPKAKPSVLDYFIVGTGLVLAVTSILLPIFIIYGLGVGTVVGVQSLFE